MREKKGEHNKSNDKIKNDDIYFTNITEEKISIPELAAAAYLSESVIECSMTVCTLTPVEYHKGLPSASCLSDASKGAGSSYRYQP